MFGIISIIKPNTSE